MKLIERKQNEKGLWDCPVCGHFVFDSRFSNEICPFCKWEDDTVFKQNNSIDNANHMSIEEYRKLYLKSLKKKER